MLRNLTIYIPTFKRHHMLPFIIEYYKNTTATVIIADATEDAFNMPTSLKSDTLQYLHMPNATHSERYSIALEMTKTDFFVPRADRRHQAAEGLSQCIQFLESNHDFDAATGIWLSENLRPYFLIDLLSSAGENNNPYERLINHSLSYQPSYYTVQRRSKAARVGRVIDMLSSITDNPYVVEYLTSFYFYLSGKTKQLSSLQGIIQDMNKVEDYSQQWPKTPLFLANKKFITIAFSHIARELDTDRIDMDKAWQAFWKASKNFVEWFYLSGISTHTSLVSKASKMPRFTILEDAYKNLGNPSSATAHEHLLRLFMTIFVEKNVYFDDVKHLFNKTDICEIQQLLDMIYKCRDAEQQP